MNRQLQRERALLSFVTSKFPKEVRTAGRARRARAVLTLALSSLVLPLKWYRSQRRARALLSPYPGRPA
jgi:hypothetical protein